MGVSIYPFCVNLVGENTYLLVSGDVAAIVDCGVSEQEDWELMVDLIQEKKITVQSYWLTHAHFDHIWGSGFIAETYGIYPQLHTDDIPLYNSFNEQMQMIVGVSSNLRLPNIKGIFEDGDILKLGDTLWRVIHTPGHTRGGVCFYCENEGVLLSGDSLFRQSIGRTDLPGGNANILLASLHNKILTLPPETIVYPGHGAPTTIGEELIYNRFI